MSLLHKASERKVLKPKLPPIGNRLIKTSVAVFICCLIYLIRGEEGNLFYSVLTAIFCLQTYVTNSKKSAKERLFGTLVGGVIGCFILVINSAILQHLPSVPDIFIYFLLSISSILVIYISVLLKQASIAYFACTVFYSITIVHLNDNNPYLFALGRMIDTTIGVIVALLVNQARLPYQVNNNILFVSGLDESLLNEKDEISKYSIFELNRMIDKGALFTIATERSVGDMVDKVRDIKLNLPVIAFNGAILFDIKTKTYLRKEVISKEAVEYITELCKKEKVCCFSTALYQDTMVIYYERFYHPTEEALYKKLRTSLYRNYMQKDIAHESDCVYLMCVNKDEEITKLYHKLKNSPIADKIRMTRRVAKDFEGYTYLRIYNKDCSKQKMLEELKQMIGAKESVTIGTIPNQYDVQIKDYKDNEVVKNMKKLYERINFRIKKSK